MEEKFELILKMSDAGIICNAEQLKGMLPNKLKPYSYVVDEGNVKQAKEDRAKLNNMVSLLQSKRKEFEEVAFVDWKKAKPILMDIEKTIKATADALGNGINDVDEKEKLAKMEAVRQDAIQVLPNLPIAIEFEKFYDRKAYDKKTMTVEKIKADIQLKINKVAQDWEMMQLFIANLTDVEVEQVKEVYAEQLDTESIARAKAKADQLIKLHEKVAVSKQNETKMENIASPVEERVEHAQEMAIEQEKTIELMPRVFGGDNFTLECLKELESVFRKYNCFPTKILKDEKAIAWLNQK